MKLIILLLLTRSSAYLQSLKHKISQGSLQFPMCSILRPRFFVLKHTWSHIEVCWMQQHLCHHYFLLIVLWSHWHDWDASVLPGAATYLQPTCNAVHLRKKSLCYSSNYQKFMHTSSIMAANILDRNSCLNFWWDGAVLTKLNFYWLKILFCRSSTS